MEADNAFEAQCSERMRRAFRISFAMWANGLRCIDEDGVTVGELRAATRASCNLGGLERWKWIDLDDARTDAGAKRPGYGGSRGIKDATLVRPSRAGSIARRVWPEILERVERAWRERFGDEAIGAVRRALDGLGRGMPWAPPEIHPSDGFWTHVALVEAGNTSGTACGGELPEETNVPLPALLGQVLSRLTLDHESGSKTSLALAANGLRLLGDGPARIRDLRVRSGISKEAVAMITGFLQRGKLGVVAADRTISLAPRGALARDGYLRLASRTSHADLRMALEEILGRPDVLSTGLVPPPGVWRGENPYLSQTKRVLANPTGALPWHPMVLHRGGWPDGS